MIWKSEELRKETKIREKIEYHERQLARQRSKLSDLYDSVYIRNKREKSCNA